MYKTIFIDLDDTILNSSENSHDTFIEMYEKYNYKRYFDSFNHFYDLYLITNKRLWEAYEKQEISKEQLNEIRFSTPLIQVGVNDPALVEQFQKDYFEQVATKKRVMPYAHEALSYLAERYALYLISNGFSGLQQRKMEAAGVDIYFKDLFLSDDIGVHKPSPEIYHYALQQAKADKSSSLMIGDNWINDVAAAKEVGMGQAYYNLREEKEFPFEPTFVLNDWREVKTYL
ncbi:MAG: YjjG family noncanonical pyrimidine nucleotidase [Phocaeicola sp.]